MNDLAVSSINERAAEEFYRRGVDAEKEGNHEKAVEFYERTLNENSDHEKAAFQLAVLYDRRAEDAKAIELYERICTSAPVQPQCAGESCGPLRGQQPLRRGPSLPRRGASHQPQSRPRSPVHEGCGVGAQPVLRRRQRPAAATSAMRCWISRSPISSFPSAAAIA